MMWSAQGDVVRDVAIGQDVVVRTNGRDFAVARGAVDGDVFPKSIVAADLGAGHAALPFQVLGFQADAGKGKNLIVRAQRGMAVNDHMGMQPATPAQGHMFADDAIRSDDAIRRRCARRDG